MDAISDAETGGLALQCRDQAGPTGPSDDQLKVGLHTGDPGKGRDQQITALFLMNPAQEEKEGAVP
jgi:hypothetical protein